MATPENGISKFSGVFSSSSEDCQMPVPPTQHTCGYLIIRVLPRSVHSKELIVWYDGEKDSPTYKKVVTHCPKCGEKLSTK
jgi:hypothetical protein